LSVFSWIGMARTLPQLLHNLYYMSVRDNLCMDRKYLTLVSFSLSVDSEAEECDKFAFHTTFASLSLAHPAFLVVFAIATTTARVTYGSGSTGLWVQLFVLSKFP